MENEVQYIETTVKNPKEIHEIQLAIEGIADALINGGKDKWTLVMAQLPKGIAAADGLEMVKVESKDENTPESVGAFTGRITGMIMKKASAEPTPEDVAGEQPGEQPE